MLSPLEFSPDEVSRYYEVRVPELSQRGGQFRGPCPIHDGERDSFTVDPETGRWFCHSTCGRGADILALEMKLTGTDFKTAKAEVFQIVGRIETGKPHNVNGANKKTFGPRGAKPEVHGGGKWREIDRYRYTNETGTLLY
jgi:phage/plasmid primase-like uncharacterized protein